MPGERGRSRASAVLVQLRVANVGVTWFGDVRFHDVPEHVQPASLQVASADERSQVAQGFSLDSDDVVVKLVAWREEDDANDANDARWLSRTDEHDVFVIIAKQVEHGRYRRSIMARPLLPDVVWRVSGWSSAESRGVLAYKEAALHFDASVADVDEFLVGEYVRVVLGQDGEVVRVGPASFDGPASVD